MSDIPPDTQLDPEIDTAGSRYASTRARVTRLLAGLSEAEWLAPVPACPGWRVRDVLAHLLGNLEDGAAGRITGAPDEQQTAEQIDRHRDDTPEELLATWAVAGELAEPVLSSGGAWMAFVDVISHEHDIREALDDVDERDTDDVRRAASLVTDPIDAGEGRRIVFDLVPGPHPDPDPDHDSADPQGDKGDGDTYVLRTSPFEALRVRLGRRSVEQVLAMDWSADPTPVLDHLFVFGPRA